MTKQLATKLLVIAMLFATSCKRDNEAVAERLVRLMEEVAAIAEKHRSDCKTMGNELATLVASKRELIALAKKIKNDPERSHLIVGAHRRRVERAGETMVRGLLKCGSHEKVRAAIKTTLIK